MSNSFMIGIPHNCEGAMLIMLQAWNTPKFHQILREAVTLLKLSVPLCIAQIASISILTADIWMMGQLSAFDLASGSLAIRLYQPFYFFSLGLLSLAGPLVAQALGAGDPQRARRTFRQGLILAVILGLIWIIPVLNGVDILIFFGQDSTTSHHAEGFLIYASFGLLPSFIFMVMRFYTSSFQRPVPQMIASLLGLALNIVLNVIFAKGLYGMPEMGLAGIALATSLSHLAMALCLGLFIQLKAPFSDVKPFRRWWIVDMPIARRIVSLGLPHSFLVLAETGMFIVAGFMIGLFGTAPLAAGAIAIQIAGMAFMIPLSVSQATSIRVGNAAGRASASDVIRTGWVAIGCCIILVLPSAFVLIAFPEILATFFLRPDDALFMQTLSYLLPLLVITGIFQIGDALHIVISATLRGLNDTKRPAIYGIIGFWVIGVGSAWLMAFQFGGGPVYLWVGLAAGLFATSAILCVRWYQKTKLMAAGGKILEDE